MFVFSGQKLRARREEASESREQLSVDANVSHSAIVLYETGHRNPSRAVLLRLAAALECSPRDLVDEDPAFVEAS